MTPVVKRLLAVILLLSSIATMAQTEDCEATLTRAQEEFSAGHFYVIPSVLSACLDQFTREQRQRAYLLLTQTYLLLDDPIGAKASYLDVLRANPEFLPDTALHAIDVIYLSRKFTATSIFSWFAKAGSNVSMPRVIYDLRTFGDIGAQENYLLKAGYQASVGGDLTITERINLRGELSYSLATYRHETTRYFNLDRQLLDERQSWIAVPVAAVYNDTRGKYRPFGYLGYSFQYLLGDRSEITLINNKPLPTSETGEREETAVTSPTLRTDFKRNRFNQSILFGGGVKIKIGLDFLIFDLRYDLGMRNVTSPSNVYVNNGEAGSSNEIVTSGESTWRFAQVDDFFRLDKLSLSFGFLHPLYKPRELKRARTRSVVKQIR